MPSKKKKTIRFSPGDRVVKKPNMTIIGNNYKNRSVPPIQHGIVKAIVYKTNARGASHPYCEVLWDGASKTDTFAANRLHPEEDKAQMLADSVEGLI